MKDEEWRGGVDDTARKEGGGKDAGKVRMFGLFVANRVRYLAGQSGGDRRHFPEGRDMGVVVSCLLKER